MAEPACKDCKFFYQPPLATKGGECMDPTKRIFPRRTASSEVDPPQIIDEEIYTCRNWTSKDDNLVSRGRTLGIDCEIGEPVKFENVPLMMGFEKRTIELKSLDVAIVHGWHEIHDAQTGEIAVQLQLEWMHTVLTSRGERNIAGPGLYARGPFDVVELYATTKEDGSIDYVSVSLPCKTDKEGYTFARAGEWLVRKPNGDVVIERDWKPSFSR